MWRPLPGPQTQAYHSPADELFYGGAAGGGKTSLMLGLSLTAHRKSLFLRRQAVQLTAAVQYLKKVAGSKGWSGSGHGGTLRANGRIIEMAGCDHEDDKEKYQGRDHDLKAFDELPHFTRGQYRFVIGWNRTDDPTQRCRVVAGGNPPTTPEGRWVVEEWAPWLDRTHPDPAAPGELRWYTVIDDELVWFRSAEPVLHKGERIVPRSRTFIPARLQDNPIYMATGYMGRLQAMPEPLRSQMLYGSFDAGVEDNPWQCIPTTWVLAAQARWTPEPPAGQPLSALGVDPARGGRDKFVISKRYGHWFAPLIKHPGKTVDDGPKGAALVVAAHEGDAYVNVDVIGIGSSVYDVLKGLRDSAEVGPAPKDGHRARGLVVYAVNNAEASEVRDRSGKYRLTNVRAASYWRLREALDPEHGDNLALPPDPELLADLCAPRFEARASGIVVEPKDCQDAKASGGNCCVKHRIGRSPDAGDACVLAHWQSPKRKLKIWA